MMRKQQILIVCVLLLLSFALTLSSVLAQEATEEAEMTEEVTAEATETEVTEETPEATEESEEDEDETPDGTGYVVQAGDNLFRIALRNGLTTAQLAEANGITNPSLIYVGQRLIIPQGSSPIVTPTPSPEATETVTPEVTETSTPEPVEAGGTYVVQAGDNLYRIALRNNTTVAILVNLNNIANPNLIFVGQRLILPSGSPDANSEDSGDSGDEASVPTATETPEELAIDVEFSSGVEVFLAGDTEALVSQATQLGVDWVKITVDWEVIEPSEGEFNFTELDAAVDAFSGAGFQVLLNLTAAPDWSRPSATELALQQPTYGPPDDLDTFGTFAGTVAERYAGKVQAYEIWYQPNNRLSWMTAVVNLRSDGFPDARLSETRYIDLLEVAYNAIKEADSDTLVLTAGLAPTGINDFYNSIDNFVFFEELLKQGALNFSDGIAVHVEGFSNSPEASCCGDPNEEPPFDTSYHFYFSETIENYRTMLNRNGGSDEALWLTRFGWGTAENALADVPADAAFIGLNTAEEQAEFTGLALSIAEERGDIAGMILYNLNGCAVGNVSACYYSVIDGTGSARPIFSAVQSSTQGD